MAPDPYRYFRVEARELLEELGKGSLGLEQAAAPESIQRLLRLAHTLKGAARVVRLGGIADLAHEMEDALVALRGAPGPVPREGIDALLGLVDAASAQLTALATPPASGTASAPEAAALGTAPLPGEGTQGAVRADLAAFDSLLAGLSAVHDGLSAVRSASDRARRLRDLAGLLADALAAPRARGAVSGSDGGARLRPLAEELRRAAATLDRQLAAGAERADRELRQVRDAVEGLRLVPAGSLFGALERAARDAAHALGRRAVFAGGGGDVRLDAQVLSVLQGALLQLVHNAVAHGIEPGSERQALGKPPEGRVALEVARRGHVVTFRLSDDGRGIDEEAVRRAARRMGLAAGTQAPLTGEALLGLLLRGGLSTSTTLTEVAGRGIGLDVVREATRRVGGEIGVVTRAGSGTCFEIRVPVTLASADMLLVEAGGRTAAIPLDSVSGTLQVKPAELASGPQGEALLRDGSSTPFLALERILALPINAAGRAPRPRPAVRLRAGAAGAVLGVDRLLGVSRVILHPLPQLAPDADTVAGVFMDGDGAPQVVLDAEALESEARRPAPAAVSATPPRLPILIVDDSLTTRMLEQSILESAGYEVDLATSGEEALDSGRRRRYALMLVDVEMPGMDGFSLLEQASREPGLRDVPAILVTSRSAPEDRRRGEAAGARGYIVKGEFDQSDFLDRVRQLVP